MIFIRSFSALPPAAAGISVAVFDISLSGDSDEFLHAFPSSSATTTFASSRFVDVDVFLERAVELLDYLVDQLKVTFK